MSTVSKQYRGLTPQAIERFRHYFNFCGKVARTKLDEYHRQIETGQHAPDTALVVQVEHEIVQAEALSTAFS